LLPFNRANRALNTRPTFIKLREAPRCSEELPAQILVRSAIEIASTVSTPR
jgi:hypothetical protein